MMGMSGAERATMQLIERRDLHANLTLCLPVPISHVARQEGWNLAYREGLKNIYGFAVVDGPIYDMYINCEVSRPWQRHAIAHEMGHVLNGDPGRWHLCERMQWLVDKTERRASITAGKLLIPDAALNEIGTMAEIAELCEVPYDLVELRVQAHQSVGPHRVTFAPRWQVA